MRTAYVRENLLSNARPEGKHRARARVCMSAFLENAATIREEIRVLQRCSADRGAIFAGR